LTFPIKPDSVRGVRVCWPIHFVDGAISPGFPGFPLHKNLNIVADYSADQTKQNNIRRAKFNLNGESKKYCQSPDLQQ
jgi:hypothetical protein